jgi:xylulokinase
MAAQVVTGQSIAPLSATPVEVSARLGETWDGYFWHRFHKVVSRTS